MRKLLTGFTFLFAVAILYAAGNDTSKATSDKMMLAAMTFNDTMPTDTIKKDTTFASAVAYQIVTDTTPTDTTKKDTMFQALAYNR